MERELSRLAVGCWQLSGPARVDGVELGWPAIDPDKVARLLADAIDSGVTLFDTASTYGLGRGEELLRSLPATATVVTKIGGIPTGRGFTRNFHPDSLEQALAASATRLNREPLDIVLLHGLPESPESVAVLERAKSRGALRAWGVAIGGSETQDVLHWIGRHPACEFVELPVSIARPRSLEVCEELRRKGITCLARSAIETGLLGGRYRALQDLPQDDVRLMVRGREESASLLRLGAALSPLARELGVTLAGLCLWFVQSKPCVSAMVVGVRTREDLAAAVSTTAGDPLPEDVCDRIARIALGA